MTDPLFVPDTTQEELQSPAQTPNASIWGGMVSSFEEGFKSTPFMDFYRWNINKGFQDYDTSPTVPADQVPEDMRKQIKGPTTQNYLTWAQSQRQDKDENDKNIAMANNSLLGKFGTFASGLVGNSLGCAIPGVASVAGRLGEGAYAAIDGMLAESKALRYGMKVANRTIEGGSVGATIGTGQYYYDKQMGEDPSAWGVIGGNALTGAGLMGLGHGLVGGVRLLRNMDAESVTKAASDQMDSNKETVVDPIIKQGQYETAQAQKSALDPEEMQNISDALGDHINNMDTDLASEPEVTKSHLGVEKLNDAISTLRKKSTMWSDAESNRLQDLQDMPYFNKVINAATDNPVERTAAQTDLLRNFSEDPSYEKGLLQSDLDSTNERLQTNADIQSKFLQARQEARKQASPFQEELNNLNSKEGSQEFFNNELEKQGFPSMVLQGLENKIEEAQNKADRFDETREKGKGAKRLRNLQQAVDDAKAERAELIRLNDNGRIEKARNKLRREKQKLRKKVNNIVHGRDTNMDIESPELSEFKHAHEENEHLKKIKRKLLKRQKELQEVDKLNPDHKAKILDRNRKMLLRDHYQSLKDHQDAVINHLNSSAVTPDELEQNVKYVRSVDADPYLKSGNSAAIEDDLSENKDLGYYQKVAQDYAKNGKIPKEIMDEVKGEHADLDKALKGSRPILKRLMTCLLAGGADE